MTTWEKIKIKIRSLNHKNIIYYICMGILIAIFLFVLITTIIQTEWVGHDDINAPILIWMITQPYVGVFFMPFMILVIYICCFIISVGKPVTIRKVKNDVRTLFENNDIKKNEYEAVFETLESAEARNLKELKAKEEQIKALIGVGVENEKESA